MPWQAAKTSRWLVLVVFVTLARAGGAADRPGLPERLPRRVLTAFQDVIRDTAKSTVQIYSDGYRSALGAVVRSDGYIVTKASELKGRIEVQLNDSRRAQKYEATTVASDAATDLAILKINAKDLPAIAWADGNAPAVGSWLITPGLERGTLPLAVGVVSVGPRKVVAPPGALGIVLDDVDESARIKEVREESPAEKSGLKEGDVIRKINGKEVNSRQQAIDTIRSHQPGDQVNLVIERQGAELAIQATLGSLATIFMFGERADFQNSLGGSLSERRAGFPLAIQHDSVLRPSDCGGPLVDLEGKAIGLNIARAGRVESYALPAALVQQTVEKLLAAQNIGPGGNFVGKSGGSEKVH
jgi:serine protease Do